MLLGHYLVNQWLSEHTHVSKEGLPSTPSSPGEGVRMPSHGMGQLSPATVGRLSISRPPKCIQRLILQLRGWRMGSFQDPSPMLSPESGHSGAPWPLCWGLSASTGLPDSQLGQRPGAPANFNCFFSSLAYDSIKSITLVVPVSPGSPSHPDPPPVLRP